MLFLSLSPIRKRKLSIQLSKESPMTGVLSDTLGSTSVTMLWKTVKESKTVISANGIEVEEREEYFFFPTNIHLQYVLYIIDPTNIEVDSNIPSINYYIFFFFFRIWEINHGQRHQIFVCCSYLGGGRRRSSRALTQPRLARTPSRTKGSLHLKKKKEKKKERAGKKLWS